MNQSEKIIDKKKAIMKMRDLSSKEKKEWIDWLEKMQKQTDALKGKFGEFYSQVNNIIFDFDPVGIANKEDKDGDYQGESEDILKKIKSISSRNELELVVKKVFIKNFYKEIVERRPSLYKNMSGDIWMSWKKHCRTTRER